MTIIIWGTPSDHNRNAAWLSEVKNKLKDLERQSKISISLGDVKHGIRRMASWKVTEPDRVHGFWYEKLSKRHGKIATELQKTLERGTVPEWLKIGRTILIMKDVKKGKVASNYKPIAYTRACKHIKYHGSIPLSCKIY